MAKDKNAKTRDGLQKTKTLRETGNPIRQTLDAYLEDNYGPIQWVTRTIGIGIELPEAYCDLDRYCIIVYSETHVVTRSFRELIEDMSEWKTIPIEVDREITEAVNQVYNERAESRKK